MLKSNIFSQNLSLLWTAQFRCALGMETFHQTQCHQKITPQYISFILTYNHWGGGCWLAKFKQPQYLLKQKSPGTTQTSEEDGEHIRVSKEVYL